MDRIVAYACTLLFTTGLVLWLGSFWRCYNNDQRGEALHVPTLKEMLALFAVLAVSRIAVYAIAYFMIEYKKDFFEQIPRFFMTGDAPHYIGIAKNGYQAIGDERFHIVFFPLYPALIKLFNLIFNNYNFSAYFLSNATTIAGCMFFYDMMSRMYGKSAAVRAIKYLLVFPAMLFYSAPYTEGLFLLSSVACMYFAYRDKMLLACICGMAAALTRSVGVVLALPLFVKWLLDLKKYSLKENALQMLMLFLVPAGLGLYLVINKIVTGDALMFLTYQHEHWNQRMGNPLMTIAMIFRNAFMGGWHGEAEITSIWIPSAVCIIGFSILLPFAGKKLRPEWGAYALALFFISMMPTWLLSAPRYLGVIFPFAALLAIMIKNKWADWTVSAVLAVSSIYYLHLYISGNIVF